MVKLLVREIIQGSYKNPVKGLLGFIQRGLTVAQVLLAFNNLHKNASKVFDQADVDALSAALESELGRAS